MKKLLIFILCLSLVPVYSFAAATDKEEEEQTGQPPVAETNLKDSTVSPTIQTDKKERPEGEKKGLKDFVITAPQLPSIKTSEDQEKSK